MMIWERIGISCSPALQPRPWPELLHHVGPLKVHLGGKHSSGHTEVENEVALWLQQQSETILCSQFSEIGEVMG
jgi:hypothetical protein